MSQKALDVFERSSILAESIVDAANHVGIQSNTLTGTIISTLNKLRFAPKSSFVTPPTYRSEVSGEVVGFSKPSRASTHGFFDVIKARSSRRDYGESPISREIFTSLLAWTFGQRDTTIAYDWRDAPLRYCPSAGGLASVDGYCIVSNVDGLGNGSYYYDYERGLVQLFSGEMGQKVAGLVPGTAWLERASALIIVVANPGRVDPKYGAMGSKLSMLDAGVAVGHLELVATALELRSCILGSLPDEALAELLCLDDQQIPLVSLAIGSRA